MEPTGFCRAFFGSPGPSPARLTLHTGSCPGPVSAGGPGTRRPEASLPALAFPPSILPCPPQKSAGTRSPLPGEPQSQGLAGKPPRACTISGHARRTPGKLDSGREAVGGSPPGGGRVWRGRARPLRPWPASSARSGRARAGCAVTSRTSFPGAQLGLLRGSPRPETQTPKGLSPPNHGFPSLRAAQRPLQPSPPSPSRGRGRGLLCVSPLCKAKEGGGRGLGVESLRDLEKRGRQPCHCGLPLATNAGAQPVTLEGPVGGSQETRDGSGSGHFGKGTLVYSVHPPG